MYDHELETNRETNFLRYYFHASKTPIDVKAEDSKCLMPQSGTIINVTTFPSYHKKAILRDGHTSFQIKMSILMFEVRFTNPPIVLRCIFLLVFNSI